MFYNFYCGISDVVHRPYPFQLMFGFQLFSDTLSPGKLFYQPRKNSFGLPVNIRKISIQFAVSQ